MTCTRVTAMIQFIEVERNGLSYRRFGKQDGVPLLLWVGSSFRDESIAFQERFSSATYRD
jgi:hypothetical protein